MERVRVLAVADSAVVRRALREALAVDGVELLAAVGSEALAITRTIDSRPGLIVLDSSVGDRRWGTLTSQLLQAAPDARFVCLVASGPQEARIRRDAAAAGFTNLIARPDGGAESEDQAAIFRAALRRAVADGGGRATTRQADVPPALRATAFRRATNITPNPMQRRRGADARVDCVAIGVSTGGPNALGVVLPALPADFPVPIVLVQHMPPVFTSNLAQTLQSQCKLRVREAVEGDLLEPGLVLIAPGDHHMFVQRRAADVVVGLHQGEPENFCRPAVDVLFRSLAEVYGGATLTVVLTGMGQDGLLGAQLLSSVGAPVVVQDEASSVVWGMPGAVARAGLADAVVPLGDVASEIQRRTQLSRISRSA